MRNRSPVANTSCSAAHLAEYLISPLVRRNNVGTVHVGLKRKQIGYAKQP
jgi:hypothetical protein